MMAAAMVVCASAAEYEVDGTLTQTWLHLNGTNPCASASFTVYVRDCGWLIHTLETNEFGSVTRREIGSTNESEIYECELLLQAAQRPDRGGTNGIKGQNTSGQTRGTPPQPTIATIIATNIPVGQLDNAVAGHLWLMFASQCYWPGLKTTRLPPVYDWRASIAAHGGMLAKEAQWDLLDGPGSLPREVRYLGQWGETNGLYRVTGTNSAGGTLIPSGFIFEESYVGPLASNSLVHEMRVIKWVVVEVTAVRTNCSRASLLPSPGERTMVIDRRVDGGAPTVRPPSYLNPTPGQWVTLDEARKLAGVRSNADNAFLRRLQALPPTNSAVAPAPDLY
jgi:hypothetical protein